MSGLYDPVTKERVKVHRQNLLDIRKVSDKDILDYPDGTDFNPEITVHMMPPLRQNSRHSSESGQV